MAAERRYFVDKRVGCIAVRDRLQTDPDYPGLHSDTRGVVRYWPGQRRRGKNGGWRIGLAARWNAWLLCFRLNRIEERTDA